MVRLTLHLVRIALLATIVLSIIGIYVYMVGHRIEPMRAIAVYSRSPTPETQRAMDEAFAEDSRIQLTGISVSAGMLLISWWVFMPLRSDLMHEPSNQSMKLTAGSSALNF